MSELTPLPMSDPGPHTGKKFHDHQRMGLSKMLFMENDYGSLYESMVRQDDSLQHRKYLDLSAFDHMWKDEGDHTWSNGFTELVGEEDMRPLQGKGMILADQMGTGKSLIILGLIEATMSAAHEWKNDNPPLLHPLPKFWNSNDSNHTPVSASTSSALRKSCATLIVCPKSVLGVWNEYWDKHWDGTWSSLTGNLHRQSYLKRPLLVHDHYANRKFDNAEAISNVSIIVTSYEALLADGRKGKQAVLHNQIFYRVVLDEGHRVRNSDTQVFKAVEKLHKRHIHILTGTPIQNHIYDLYAYARLLDLPSGLSNSDQFESLCVAPAMGEYPNTVNLRVWGQIFALRRLSYDLIQINLPPKEIKVFWLDRKMLPEQFEGVEDRVSRPWFVSPCEEEGNGAQWVSEFSSRIMRGHMDRYRALTSKGSIKMRWFRFFLLRQTHGKIVVFHHFKTTLKQAQAVLEAEGYTITYLQSELSMVDRIKVTGDFNSSKQRKLCLLSSIKVGGEGLSMVGGSACVFLDLMWNPTWHEQAIGRLHRQGQTNPVIAYMPITHESYEDEIWFRQDTKRHFSHRLFPNDPCGDIEMSEVPAELLEWFKTDGERRGFEDDDNNHDDDCDEGRKDERGQYTVLPKEEPKEEEITKC